MIGYFFGEDKNFNQMVLKEFLMCFSFRRLSIDSCWRLIFHKSGLPKEGQQIIRVMTVF
jgi:Sec7-like guanine-nucleotide exchange factor